MKLLKKVKFGEKGWVNLQGHVAAMKQSLKEDGDFCFNISRICEDMGSRLARS